MNCQKKDKFPPSPSGKTSWPWTEETTPSQDTMPKSLELPKISIVTPSYNQGQFIEETIRSVLLQGYPNLEYIIIDGGSTDNSVEIIKKYEPWLAYWVSEKDNGQSHAINKGWQKATGDIMAYLNSDDTFREGALYHVASYFLRHPDIDMAYGDVFEIDENSRMIKPWICGEFDLDRLIADSSYYIPQQAAFFKRRVYEKTGPLDEGLYMKMDRDLFIRIGKCGHVKRIPHYLAHFRTHSAAKTNPKNNRRAWTEFIYLARRHSESFPFRAYWKLIVQKSIAAFVVKPLKKLGLWSLITPILKKNMLKRELYRYDNENICPFE
jgi:glycosyltransferase involved in cell wall biosynthesis